MAEVDLAELRRLAGGYRASQAIYAMVALGVPDALAAGPASGDQVAASVGADPATMSRLLRALSDLGILARDGDGSYRLTHASTSLRADEPDGLRAMILGWSALPVGYSAFGALHYAVRTGGNAFEHTYGQRFHDYLDHDPGAAEAYEAATESTVTAFDEAIRAGEFGRFANVVDVGGGQGTFLEALLQQYPSARGVLLEVPRVAADARDRLRGRPGASRIDIVAGDMFASIPRGGNAYVFLTVLRCFNDEECRKILARLWESMSDTSRLLALEMVYPDDPIDGRHGLADLQAMVVYGGADRTAIEWQELLLGAGFETPIITPVDQSFSWVEAARANDH